jgi:hypothetical protein
MACPLCKTDDETLIHLTTCPALQSNWLKLEDDITKKILKHVKKHNKKSPTYQQINRSIFEYNDPALSMLKQRNRIELSRGLISHTITTKLRRFSPHSIHTLT